MGVSLPGTYSSSSTIDWSKVNTTVLPPPNFGVDPLTPTTGAQVALTGVHYAQLAHQQQQASLQQQLTQAQLQQQYYPGSGVVVGGGVIPSVLNLQQPRAIAKATITDIYGYTFTIDVDTSVLHYIAAINNTHRPMHATFVNMPKQAPLDADFSLDELERAEKLMEEMSAPA